MRNILIGILILCLLFVAAVYIFIPGKLEIVTVENVNCNVTGAFRKLGDFNTWQKWWPQSEDSFGRDKKSQPSFFLKGYHFQPTGKFYNSVGISINNDNVSAESRLNIIRLSLDSAILIWKCELYSGLNPFAKIEKYREAKKLKSDMADVLEKLGSYLGKKENIYGINLHVTMSQDSTLVAIKKPTDTFPSTVEIYDLIKQLEKYILLQGAKENNFPMLHVKRSGNKNFETMVAIPVNRELPGNSQIFFSRFVPWKVLTAEVKGGNSAVEEALRQMKLYINDYQITSMAVPFESLVTNRMNEPDTTKWITKIYTPVP
jgi:hypothetical protein